MSVLTVRGGVPHVFRATIDTTGRVHQLPFTSNYLKIRTSGSPCKLFFHEIDFDADENYVLAPMPSPSQPYGEWEGPVEVSKIWVKGDGSSCNIELVAFQRRG